MKPGYFVVFIVLAVLLFSWGVIGTLGTAVSYKYEIEDPAAITYMEDLSKEDQARAIVRFEERKEELAINEIMYIGMIVSSVVLSILLFLLRKRVRR